MFARTVSLSLALVACASAERRDGVSPLNPTRWENPAVGGAALSRFASPEGASCRLEGALRLTTEIHATATEWNAMAQAERSDVGVEVLALAPRGSYRSKVRVRSVPMGPAIVVEGWIGNIALPLRLVRQVDVVPGYAWFSEGSVVEVVAGNGDRVRIRSADYHCSSDFGVSAETDCAALALDPKAVATRSSSGPHARKKPGYQPKRAPLRLLGKDGKPVLELGDGVFELVDKRGALGRISHRGSPSILGWVATSDIVPEVPSDRDDCMDQFLDSVDRCPDDPENPLDPEDSDGCPEGGVEVEAARDFPLRLERRLDAPIVGHVERGVRIRIPRNGTRFISVTAVDGGLTGPLGAVFWALANDVR